MPNQLSNYNEKILGDKQSLVFFRAGSSIFKTNRVQIYTHKKNTRVWSSYFIPSMIKTNLNLTLNSAKKIISRL